MIKIFCNWCEAETTKKYLDMHVCVNENGREIARQYHICPKCGKELLKLMRKDDNRK